jgi:hypothetical protein
MEKHDHTRRFACGVKTDAAGMCSADGIASRIAYLKNVFRNAFDSQGLLPAYSHALRHSVQAYGFALSAPDAISLIYSYKSENPDRRRLRRPGFFVAHSL